MKLSNNKLLDLYEMMYRIRRFELRAKDVFLAGEMPGFIHIYAGEEAIATGVCSILEPKDQICSTHRGHGHCIAKGGRTDLMFAELLGKEAGYCKGKGGSMHISNPELGILGANGIVGAGMPIAVGAAFEMMYDKTGAVSVVFFGDGASNRGTFHEALNMASIWKLPVVFVCENNQFAQFTRQTYHMNISDISVRGVAYGIEGVSVDGNDLLAVREAAEKAVKKARDGEGPTLITCNTWRHFGHYVGDPEVYRTKEEKAVWEAPDQDPIPRFEKYLTECGSATAEDCAKIHEKIDQEIEDAIAFAKVSPYPPAEDLLKGTFVEY